MNLHLIGCGGTGSWLAEPLVRLLKYHANANLTNILLYDGDSYEENNLTRQLFPAHYVGRNKAEVLKTSLENNGCDISITAHSQYLNETFFNHFLNRYEDFDTHLVVVAIDNEHGRHDIINALTKYEGNFICILPGNEFRTATAIWFARKNGELYPCHPFDVADNYANPTDKPRGNCAYEVISSPQLINANFASALISLEIVYTLLEGGSLPFCVRYNGEQFSQTYDGKLRQYGELQSC